MTAPPTGEPRWRLFIAAPVPVEAARELFEKMADLHRRHPDVRWAKVDQLHATIVFLGQTAQTDAERLVAGIDAAVRGYGPIEANTAESGGRAHDRRDGVAWLRIERGSRDLAALSVDVDHLIGSNQYVSGAPRPHITVARRVDQAFLRDLRTAAPDLRTEWTFDRIGLYRSFSEPGGSRYEALHSAPLTRAKSSA